MKLSFFNYCNHKNVYQTSLDFSKRYYKRRSSKGSIICWIKKWVKWVKLLQCFACYEIKKILCDIEWLFVFCEHCMQCYIVTCTHTHTHSTHAQYAFKKVCKRLRVSSQWGKTLLYQMHVWVLFDDQETAGAIFSHF